jgi:hypothetical protein
MTGFLLWLLVGWPAVLVTVVLVLIGLIKNNHRFLFAAAIIAFPISWFLSGLPEVHFPAILNIFLSAFLYGSSYFMFRGREMIAWLLAIPFFLAVLLLLFAVWAGGA